ncbi:hypothetical protein pEaSNUABM39_00092 [Erwinia phage pEa_SNUABM_39]|nr:hypothetical protein pEaSNUABM39_00092 [Erwinia phage pEa_SNUABM_39]
MQFHSVGAVKVNKIRKDALSALFLFDSTIDKAVVKQSRANLLKNVPYCRGTSWGFSGSNGKTTALSGIKNNKHYVAHTSDMLGFNQNSNSKDWYYYPSTNDGQTVDTQAYRYVTVTPTTAKGGMSDLKTNFLGAGAGKTYSPTSGIVTNRMYFVPESILASMRVAATGGIRANLTFNGQTINISKYESSSWLGWNYQYTLYWSSAAYLTQTNTLQTQTDLTTTDTTKQYGQGNTLPVVLPSMYTTNAPCIMFIAVQEETQMWPIGGGTVRFSYSPTLTDFPNCGLAEPLYVPMKVASDDSPPCVLSFGAIAYEYPLDKGLIVLSIGDGEADDAKQTGTNIAEMASLNFSADVVSYVNATAKYLL